MSWVQLGSTEPVARKEYHCQWCPERIVKGEKHAHYSGIMDGDFQDTRMHLECLAASQRDWSYDNELCGESHFRGMDCEQTEAARVLEATP